jgi:uncharacterized protein
MINSRATLEFCSDSGREYLYDDVTGQIFAWSGARESVLRSLLSGDPLKVREDADAEPGPGEVEASNAFVQRALHNYGAFVRPRDPLESLETPTEAELREYISGTCRQLVLTVTEDCNLRCRYCVYSGNYLYHRPHSRRAMTEETALKSVDWFAGMVQPQITVNPRKKFGLSFYGGEPLLNFDVVDRVLGYVRERYPGLFYPVLTTNGTLLTPGIVRTLVANDVGIAVSLDGPQQEHDRRRIDPAGRGSFQRIMRNLDWFRHEYPEYCRTKVYSSCVFDWCTDLDSVERFFAGNEGEVPYPIFVTQAGSSNTRYYESFADADRRRCQGAIESLRQRFKTASISGQPISAYLSSSVGMAAMRILIRPRLQDQRPPFLPCTGTCVPGAKVAVGVDGVLEMCERTNGTYPIGDLARGGIDHGCVSRLIREYQEKVIARCRDCPVTRLCDLCFSNVEGNGGVGNPSHACSAQKARAVQSLADYVSILEKNRAAPFILRSDSTLLETRSLFYS